MLQVDFSELEKALSDFQTLAYDALVYFLKTHSLF